MKIKMLTRIAGPDFSGAPGDVLDLAEAIAKVLVEGGFAEVVGEVETTDMPPGERAVNKAGARRAPRPKRSR